MSTNRTLDFKQVTVGQRTKDGLNKAATDLLGTDEVSYRVAIEQLIETHPDVNVTIDRQSNE